MAVVFWGAIKAAGMNKKEGDEKMPNKREVSTLNKREKRRSENFEDRGKEGGEYNRGLDGLRGMFRERTQKTMVRTKGGKETHALLRGLTLSIGHQKGGNGGQYRRKTPKVESGG